MNATVKSVARPLDGIRVLDLGIITAGAATSALLADLGAEVIKIESPTYRDPFRQWVRAEEGGADLPFFLATNRNKLSVGLNLKEPAGRDVMLRLVEKSDVVVENFRRGVLQRFDLGFETLRQRKPSIVLASISSQGETGPEADQVSFGSTLEGVSGLAWLTGYAGGPPVVSGVDLNYPDQVVAIYATSMIVTACLAGGGVHLDLSQRELTSFMVGEAFLMADDAPRRGNFDPDYVAQGCLLAADGLWVGFSIDAATATKLPAVIGGAPGTLDATLTQWAKGLPASRCVTELTAAGASAAIVADGMRMLAERRWQEALVETSGGLFKGAPFRFADRPAAIERFVPPFGADSRDVLQRVAGLTTYEVEMLIEQGVVEVPRPTLDRQVS